MFYFILFYFLTSLYFIILSDFIISCACICEMKHTQKNPLISLQCVQSNTNQGCRFELVKLEQVCSYTADFACEWMKQSLSRTLSDQKPAPICYSNLIVADNEHMTEKENEMAIHRGMCEDSQSYQSAHQGLQTFYCKE